MHPIDNKIDKFFLFFETRILFKSNKKRERKKFKKEIDMTICESSETSNNFLMDIF